MFDLDAENSVSDLVAPMYRSVEEITAGKESQRAGPSRSGCR